MTSEVVVMNRMGIALAADSVVSIYANGVQKKRHDSAAKLFMLSEWHPVGIMVYNNASLLGVPWETILKLFRRFLGTAWFPRLEQYGEELVEFLVNNKSLFPDDVQQKYLRKEFEAECHRILEEAQFFYDMLPLWKRVGDERALKERSAIIQEVIEERLKKWKSQEDAEGFTEKIAKDFLIGMSGEVNPIIMRVFSEWPVESTEVNKLNEIARHLVFKQDLEIEGHTGLVIGGFGEDEHYPVVQHIEICGMYEGILKHEGSTVERICEENPSYVESYADSEAVNDFLYGASDRVLDEVDKAVEVIRNGPGEALQSVTGMRKAKKEELIRATEAKSESRAKHVREKIQLLIARRFGGILDVAEILPLKELASVASTLVRLSSFDKQLSLEAETVGEPIDVAVISKGDGFIWINRKHYFNAELNHRYFRGSGQPEKQGEERNE